MKCKHVKIVLSALVVLLTGYILLYTEDVPATHRIHFIHKNEVVCDTIHSWKMEWMEYRMKGKLPIYYDGKGAYRGSKDGENWEEIKLIDNFRRRGYSRYELVLVMWIILAMVLVVWSPNLYGDGDVRYY